MLRTLRPNQGSFRMPGQRWPGIVQHNSGEPLPCPEVGAAIGRSVGCCIVTGSRIEPRQRVQHVDSPHRALNFHDGELEKRSERGEGGGPCPGDSTLADR